MLVLPVDKKVLVKAQPVDNKGNPAVLDEDPVWSASNNVVTVSPNPGNGDADYSAWVTPAKLGETQVRITSEEIVGIVDIEVVSGQAVSFVMSYDVPVYQKKNK